VALDGQMISTGLRGATLHQAPPFVRWDRFLPWFLSRWEQGQHVILVGQTSSGKTTLARQIIPYRDYTVVLATKSRDPSLYGPLQRQGFRLVSSFDGGPDPDHPKDPVHLIFRPPLRAPTRAERAAQAGDFREALTVVYIEGGWCVYADELRYLTDNLGLETEIETLYLQGRSLGVTMVSATQRPVSVPQEAFSQSEHAFFYREGERRNIDRMAEFDVEQHGMIRATLPRLGKHECLYVQRGAGVAVRTQVLL
jgi:hypothetical protein